MVFKEVIKLNEDIVVGPNPMIGILVRRKNVDTDTTEKGACENTGRR